MKRTKKLDKLVVELTAKKRIDAMGYLSKMTIAETIKQLKILQNDPTRASEPSWYKAVTYDPADQAMIEEYVARLAIEKLKSKGEVE